MKQVRLGRMQLRIMSVLWERGSASARQITDALCRERPVAHSTVQTLLRKLQDKGAVRHEVADRTFVFHPTVDSRSITRGATRELIERVFGGSAGGLVAHLLKEERISEDELDVIRKLIDRHESGKKGKP
ncbi:MAG TPA: BlaI/MecI/CopY family transcriptional regulator [Tepidisphaeraceae bacterium]|nr:BlaI/MecI/CopY family transcriptional regulator [Tepidisphaeraceae bacterium]